MDGGGGAFFISSNTFTILVDNFCANSGSSGMIRTSSGMKWDNLK